MRYTDTIDQIKQDEGFRARPYQCSEGVWTIGYGTTFMLTDEAEMLLVNHLDRITRRLKQEDFYTSLSLCRKSVLQQMAYQLGFDGLLKFKKMIASLKGQDYERAAQEMLDSLWAKQTPGRAERLATQMKTGEER